MNYTKEQVIALADQLTCHPASRSIDEIEMAGDMLRDSVTQRTELADDRDTWKARAEFSYTERAKLERQRDELLTALEETRRELDACQKVIWLASDYGFDPTYVNGAKAAIKVADAAISSVKGQQ